MKKIKKALGMDFMILQKWFWVNFMALNQSKFHCIVIGDNDPSNKKIWNTIEVGSSYKENF